MAAELAKLGDKVGPSDLVAGSKRDFTVKYDPNKITVDELVKALEASGEPVTKAK